MFPFIYLASQSPRRTQLLTQLGVPHALLLPDEQEDVESLEFVLPHEAPKTYVQRVTRLKLAAALQRLQRRQLPLAPVLCVDTTVALGRSIYGKPQDDAHAQRILQALSGRTHRVITALALGLGGRHLEACSISQVSFSRMSESEICAYVASQEPQGKAGAYAVQGAAAAYISRISGSYSGIMGLPLFETAQLLRRWESSSCNKTY